MPQASLGQNFWYQLGPMSVIEQEQRYVPQVTQPVVWALWDFDPDESLKC